jgi:hypothetical protein
MPASERGGIHPGLGTTFGLAVHVNDNDGAGAAARTGWGLGLAPEWSPAQFGTVTMVE